MFFSTPLRAGLPRNAAPSSTPDARQGDLLDGSARGELPSVWRRRLPNAGIQSPSKIASGNKAETT
jgi:hypothetical protein